MPDTMSIGSTDMFLAEKLLFDLYTVASKDDPEQGLYKEISPEEKLIIEKVVKELVPIVDNEFIESVEHNYNNFKALVKDIKTGNGKSVVDLDSENVTKAGLSPMYRRFLEFYLMMDFDRYKGMGMTKKHGTLISSLVGYFNIRSSKQLDMFSSVINEIRQGIDTGSFGGSLESKLNPESSLSRTVMKNFIWECYSNDGELDAIEEDIAMNFGKVLFGYKPEDVYEQFEEMLEENEIIKRYADNPEEMEIPAKNDIEKDLQERLGSFVKCIEYALADNIISHEEDTLLREVGNYFGIREEEVYKRIVENTRKQMHKDKEEGNVKVLVINGDSYYSNVISAALKDSVYTAVFAGFDDIVSGNKKFEDINPNIVFVDPLHDKSKLLIKAIKHVHPDTKVYALASKGVLRPGEEHDKAKEYGTDGYFHIQRMFPGVFDAIKTGYVDYRSEEH
ncbi:hypothetical protein GF345_01170 [Candidatus Woesearchaeota archaeon]|nr:hypothetical protein [Candidatus Woesearchaeota archaeon]